jgi:hypothetical protein
MDASQLSLTDMTWMHEVETLVKDVPPREKEAIVRALEKEIH